MNTVYGCIRILIIIDRNQSILIRNSNSREKDSDPANSMINSSRFILRVITAVVPDSSSFLSGRVIVIYETGSRVNFIAA